MTQFADWLSHHSGPEWGLFVKRLSGNDTGLTGSHQVGIYLPKEVAFDVLPELAVPHEANPDLSIAARIASHGDSRTVRAVWYNQKTRNEIRLTRWGGRSSPIQNPENTGAVAVLAFRIGQQAKPGARLNIWVCETASEEDLLQERIGLEVEPGEWMFIADGELVEQSRHDSPCSVHQGDLPPQWAKSFPSGEEIVRFVGSVLPASDGLRPDDRLLARRACEFTVFSLVEKVHVLPRILDGFDDVESFLSVAHSVTNRRKARSGRSLELHLRTLFEEEGLPHSHGPVVEGGKRPDFLFPSEDAYHDPSFPPGSLTMLAVKTTLKDRWRQILNEADRIPQKHLLTLQEGVSESQFREMNEAGVSLVVPQPLFAKFPKAVRPQLTTVEAFLQSVRTSS